LDAAEFRITRSVYLVGLDTNGTSPIELFSCPPGQAGDFFWLSDETAAYLNGSSLYSLTNGSKSKELKQTRLFDFPAGISASGLQYEAKTGHLAFTAQVWDHDGSFEAVGKLNDKYENRGDTAQVYDELFIR
jgi:hypothetical protein